MGLSSNYPLLDLFFTVLIVFAWVLYIWVAVTVIIDIFRRDISGFAKVLWVLVVLIFSWLGVLLYLLLNHRGMAERRQSDVQAAQAQFDQAVRAAAGSGGAAAQIESAKRLLDSGTITSEEYEKLKAQALSG
jgi:signal transduction histidine kinase